MHQTESQKVFGLGLSKTGTTSLGEALNALGFRTVHYPCDQETFRQLQRGDYRLRLLERFDGIVDITVAPFYPQLDEEYPGSKFILTVRDKTAWLASAEEHWIRLQEWSRRYLEFDAVTRFLCACVYGTWGFDRRRFEYVYDLHLENVIRYFEHRPDDLLVMDIADGDGWDDLCPFLGVTIPGGPFPHSNKMKGGQAVAERQEWCRTLDIAARELAQTVPAGESLILIDDDQLSGSILDAEFRALPFLEKDGAYWGAPPDDGTAILELERMRSAGASFLVLTWPAFWWKEAYPELTARLYNGFASLLDNERLIVFDLRREASGDPAHG